MWPDEAPQQLQSGISRRSIPSSRATTTVDSPYSWADDPCEQPGK